MPAYVSAPQPNASEYDVHFATGNLNDYSEPERGVRLSATGEPYLGARRHIRSHAADPVLVQKDVKDCKDRAAAGGVFSSTRMSTAADSAG